MSGEVTAREAVPGLPHVSWYAEAAPTGLWLHFNCTVCRDATMRRCENPARARHWARVYALDHVHGVVQPPAGPPRPVFYRR